MSTDLNYYQLLDLTPEATSNEIRNAYRQKSKIYHPDTTLLSKEIATQQFQLLNKVYSTLNNPDLRRNYDCQLGINNTQYFVQHKPRRSETLSSSSLIDIQERPLSAGELFALLVLGLTFLGCLVLALILGFARGEMILQQISMTSQCGAHPML